MHGFLSSPWPWQHAFTRRKLPSTNMQTTAQVLSCSLCGLFRGLRADLDQLQAHDALNVNRWGLRHASRGGGSIMAARKAATGACGRSSFTCSARPSSGTRRTSGTCTGPDQLQATAVDSVQGRLTSGTSPALPRVSARCDWNTRHHTAGKTAARRHCHSSENKTTRINRNEKLNQLAGPAFAVFDLTVEKAEQGLPGACLL